MWRWLVNVIIVAGILWMATIFFPTKVIARGHYTILMAAALLSVAEILVMLVIFLMMASTVLTGNLVGAIAGIISIFFAEIIAISLLSSWLPGLTIVGFWPKFWLALAFSVFRIPSNNE